MADELIKLDTTIIGIDNLINKASTAEEAKVLFTVKDVIYSQQRYFTDVQPMKRGEWQQDGATHKRCSNCKQFLVPNLKARMFNFCPNCGAKMEQE